MITRTLKRQVAREANLLKKYATKEELDRLNAKLLKPFKEDGCIYGQMTGDCFGSRATDLIHKCAVPAANHISSVSGAFLNPVKLWVKRAWNGVRGRGRLLAGKLTAIEAYIAERGSKKDKLIDYLQGRTEVLDI